MLLRLNFAFHKETTNGPWQGPGGVLEHSGKALRVKFTRLYRKHAHGSDLDQRALKS